MATWGRLLRSLACAGLFLAMPALCAVPVGYRYIGSRVVSEGRVVYWYWNVDYVEIGPYNVSFVARLYARAVDVNQERPYVAVIRCDSRTYRELGSTGPYEVIAGDEPIDAVWRAGCHNGRAVTRDQRHAQLNGTGAVPVADAGTNTVVAAAAVPPPTAAATKRDVPADPRRVDQCVRFSEAKSSPAGDATITNTCAFPVEVMLCYRGGGGGMYDCPGPPRGKRSESLAAGVTHTLPEYKRPRHRGIVAVACRGTLGAIFPRLDEAAGTTGCS